MLWYSCGQLSLALKHVLLSFQYVTTNQASLTTDLIRPRNTTAAENLAQLYADTCVLIHDTEYTSCNLVVVLHHVEFGI